MGSASSSNLPPPSTAKEHCARPVFVPNFEAVSPIPVDFVFPAEFVAHVLDPSSESRFKVTVQSCKSAAVLESSFWATVEQKLGRSISTLEVKQGAPERSSQRDYPGWDSRIRFGCERDTGMICSCYLLEKDVVVDVVVDAHLVDNYKGWCYF